uniref:Uncharacterized protein n=1 Tax=Leersia perrieri TaxID=77586 RepID=A0A0D9VBT0_9ORYZ
MFISVFYGRIWHGDRWATWHTWIELAHEGVAVVWWTLTTGLVAVLFQQDWESIGGGASIRCGGDVVLPMRNPSSVFCWANSGYAFGRRNPLGAAVEVPTSYFP